MITTELESLIPSINDTRDYWFIRTDDGIYFETFYNEGYVGIGWNEISYSDLRNSSPGGTEVKEKIARINNYATDTTNGKKRITESYNKIIRFNDMKKGDVVLIPSNSSSRFAFGIINDNVTYEHIDSNCPYIKRRKVKWVKMLNSAQLDPKFFMIRLSRHAISDINKYAYLIDNITNDIYKKGEYCYYCFNVSTNNDISVKALTNFMSSIQKLCGDINIHFNLNEDVENISITLNLQSPGKIVLKLRNGLSYIILAAILTGCSTGNASVDSRINNYKMDPVNKTIIDSVDNIKADLEIASTIINND